MKAGILSNNHPPDVFGVAEICAQQLTDVLSQREELFVFAGEYNPERRFSRYRLKKSDDARGGPRL